MRLGICLCLSCLAVLLLREAAGLYLSTADFFFNFKTMLYIGEFLTYGSGHKSYFLSVHFPHQRFNYLCRQDCGFFPFTDSEVFSCFIVNMMELFFRLFFHFYNFYEYIYIFNTSEFFSVSVAWSNHLSLFFSPNGWPIIFTLIYGIRQPFST